MPATAIDYGLSVEQALGISQDNQDAVGHMRSLQIGSTELVRDVSLKSPLDDDDGGNVSVVGPLSWISWSGGPNDAIDFVVLISTYNKQQVEAILDSQLESSPKVKFSFAVYDYDRERNRFWVGFRGAADEKSALNGLISEKDGRLMIALDPSPMEVGGGSPQFWSLSAAVVPQGSQVIASASADDMRVANRWGE